MGVQGVHAEPERRHGVAHLVGGVGDEAGAAAPGVLREIEAGVAAEKGALPEPLPPVEEAPATRASLRLLLRRTYLLRRCCSRWCG
ncbi:hypothetical protein GCM10010524_65380 [Streptomyces mexicanus]